MSNTLSAGEAARLARELRAAEQRFEEQRAQSEKQFADRQQATRKSAAAQLERVRNEARDKAAALTREHEAAVAGLQQNAEARLARIQKGQASSQKRAFTRIEETEGRAKYSVQKQMLETERSRAERLAGAEKDFENLSAELEAKRNDLQRLAAAAYAAFGGYPGMRKWLTEPGEAPQEEATLGNICGLEQRAAAGLRQFRARIVPVFFRFSPLWLWILLAVGLAALGPQRLGQAGLPGLAALTMAQWVQWIGAVLAVVVIAFFLGRALSAPIARTLAQNLQKAAALLEKAVAQAQSDHTAALENIRNECDSAVAAAQAEWEAAVANAAVNRGDVEEQVREKYERVQESHAELARKRQARAEVSFRSALEETKAAEAAAISQIESAREQKLSTLQAEHAAEKARREREWHETAEPIRAQLGAARSFAEQHFPPWSAETRYEPPQEHLNAVKFGEATLEAAAHGEPQSIIFPLMLAMPGEASLLIEADAVSRDLAIRTLNNIVFRVLTTVPAGKVAFTLIDPVRLGQSFSGIMHLADFEENIVNRRIWTEPGEIEERLLELNAHMEKVIQMYLRNEFADIVEYNRQAGRIAEKYHFLVLADFPANLTDNALRRLMKIVSSGARCGVYTLIHWDKRQALPPGFEPKELIEKSVHLQLLGGGLVMPRLGTGVKIRLDAPPAPEIATRFLHAVGEASRGSNVVQVPFAQVAPPPEKIWSLDTTEELRVPIGRSGATKLQYFSLGKGTRQHVLIAGKTGSGKSTLLHVLVTNLALWASPEQVEFYLVDFKKGVEFKDYAAARLPHAKVVAIESDREFGLSVLRRVDDELRRRGELFRAAGAQDLSGFKGATGQAMPRVLLVIDEFQELFVEDDALSQNAALLLDRIVRQGRAFGIHVVLGSQTLGGAYSLARSTLGQMVVRIALQTTEADAYLIMDESNPAPRLLSRPGEGIYNDSGGSLEANSPFQVVWLGEDERRAALERVRSIAGEKGMAAEPVVFEGNTPADLGENPELRAVLAGGGGEMTARAWLGLPNEIKGPTEVLFEPQTGRNLLIVGQQEETSRSLLAAALLSLAAQPALRTARFVLLDSAGGGAPDQVPLAGLAPFLPAPLETPKTSEAAQVLRGLAEELEARESGSKGAITFVLVYNLSGFKALRMEDEFSLSLDERPSAPADFQRLLAEGPLHGIHIITHVDSFNNVSRFLGRKGLREFQARVLLQMSASDSASLCDDPRASNLGLNRALLYNEQAGTYELFRPYARPAAEWLRTYHSKLVGPQPAPAAS